MILLTGFLRRVRRLFRVARATLARRAFDRANLAKACTRLPEPAGSIYLLSARDGLSLVRIAVQLDLPVATVERELATALLLLASDDIAVTSSPVRR